MQHKRFSLQPFIPPSTTSTEVALGCLGTPMGVHTNFYGNLLEMYVAPMDGGDSEAGTCLFLTKKTIVYSLCRKGKAIGVYFKHIYSTKLWNGDLNLDSSQKSILGPKEMDGLFSYKSLVIWSQLQ